MVISKDEREFYLDEIYNSKTYVSYANEELAAYLFPYVKERYPQTVLIKLNGAQYICKDDKAKSFLKRRLKERLEVLKSELTAVEDAIETLL